MSRRSSDVVAGGSENPGSAKVARLDGETDVAKGKEEEVRVSLTHRSYF